MKRYITHALLAVSALMPAVVLAQGGLTNRACQLADGTAARGFTLLLCNVGTIINILVGVLGALALLVFFWGLVKYIAKAGDEKAKEEGKNVMVYGVIALFVLFSVFGLVRFLNTAFGLSSGQQVRPPVIAI